MVSPKLHKSGIRNSLTKKYNDLKSQVENPGGADNILYSLYKISMQSWKSHEKRVADMSREIIGYNLSLNDRAVADNYLTAYKVNVMENSKRIKNADNVISATDSLDDFLYKGLENSTIEIREEIKKDSKPMSLTERAITKIIDTDIPYGTPGILEGSESKYTENVIRPDFESYSKTRSEKAPGFLRRAGKALTKTLVYGAAAALIGLCVTSGIGNDNKPNAKINEARVGMVSEKEDNKPKTTPEQSYAKLAVSDSYAEKNNEIAQPTEEIVQPAEKNLIIKSSDEEVTEPDQISNQAFHTYTFQYASNFDSEDFQKKSPKKSACEELGIQKQQYLIDKPEDFDYPKRLHKRCEQLNKEGKHLEDAVTRVGWVAAVGNDVMERPVRFISGLCGGLWGAGSKIIGNKNDGFKTGWKNGDQFGAYVMDGFYGGVTKTEFDGKLLSLDLKGALEIPYGMEDTTLGGHAKLGQVIWWDFIAPFVANNNFSGGEGGSNPVKPVIKPVEGVTGGRTGGVGLR